MCHGTVTYRICRVGATRHAFFTKEGTHGYEKAETLADHKSADRVESGQRKAFFGGDLKNNPDTSHARNLLDELAEGRDESILFAVIVAVDAGVDTARKQRVGKQHQKRCAARFPEKTHSDPVGVKVHEDSDKDGQSAGENESENEIGARFFLAAEGVIAAADRIAHKLGDGCLDRGGGQCETEAENRPDQLIDTERFCTNRAGEEYSIEEANDSA